MWTGILVVYAGVALVTAAHVSVRLARARPRRGEHIDGVDRALLGAVALLASAGWGLLLPMRVVGWLGSAQARALAARVFCRAAAPRPRLALWRWVRHAVG